MVTTYFSLLNTTDLCAETPRQSELLISWICYSWLFLSLCTFAAGFSRVCSCFIWRRYLEAGGIATAIEMAEARVRRLTAKVYAGNRMGWQIRRLIGNQSQNFWRQTGKMSNEDHPKDTPKTNKQTNKHQALHPPVLLALASGSCRTALLTNLCVAFTCQTQDATAKK